MIRKGLCVHDMTVGPFCLLWTASSSGLVYKHNDSYRCDAQEGWLTYVMLFPPVLRLTVFLSPSVLCVASCSICRYACGALWFRGPGTAPLPVERIDIDTLEPSGGLTLPGKSTRRRRELLFPEASVAPSVGRHTNAVLRLLSRAHAGTSRPQVDVHSSGTTTGAGEATAGAGTAAGTPAPVSDAPRVSRSTSAGSSVADAVDAADTSKEQVKPARLARERYVDVEVCFWRLMAVASWWLDRST